ncbi:MAG: iron ABC transporter permease [Sedimentisphaerales bacterium]|nr:iron ABC transporter permease [Sedimentisphaerales bacterium]
MTTPLTPTKLILQVALGVVLLVGVMVLCCLVGTQEVSLRDVLKGPGTTEKPNLDYEIIVRIRLPRVLLASAIGLALAASGAVFQALLRNPLADPYILGVSSGAGLGAIIAVMSGIQWAVWWGSPVALFAFGGAMAAIWLVWMIGRAAGRGNMTSLLLAGVVVNAFLSAVIMFLISVAGSEHLQTTIFWLMGNLNAAALEDVRVIWLTLGLTMAGVFVLFLLGARLNIISFGDSDAHSVGVSVVIVQRIAFIVAGLITAVAVSFSGLIGFVGLIVPHAVRLLLGADHRRLIPLSAIFGGIFLMISDTFARIVVAPAELPVGVVTALVGGPFFLVLLVRYARRGHWGD